MRQSHIRHGLRIPTILKDTRGSSIMFVLAITLLLLAVGISVLAAGAAAMGAGKSREITAQMQLYNDSVHKTVKTALYASMTDFTADTEDAGNTGTLGGLILRQAYLNADDNTLPDDEFTFELDNFALTGAGSLGLGAGVDFSVVQSIQIVVIPTVAIEEAVPSIWIEYYEEHDMYEEFDWEGYFIGYIKDNVHAGWECTSERSPKSATVSAEVNVTVTISYLGRQMASTARYTLRGARIEDQHDSVEIVPSEDPINRIGDVIYADSAGCYCHFGGFYGDITEKAAIDQQDDAETYIPMQIRNVGDTSAGIWEMISYEKIPTPSSAPTPGPT